MASGKLWNINSLVQIKDDVLAIDGIYLISKVIFTLDSSGSKTIIETMPPESYSRSVKNNEDKKSNNAKSEWGDVKYE
jgi:prophage tail gpP-like protein